VREQPRHEAFYGWRIVGASFFVLFVTVGAGLYVPPVFLVPLQEQFGWSRAVIAGGTAVAALMTAVASPLAGVWIDRYGARKVMTAGALLMGTAFVLLSSIRSLWQLYALNIAAALGLSCSAWVPNQTLVSNWFTRKRGLAMGIALTGIGFGGMFMAPLGGSLIAAVGWRHAFACIGALILGGVIAVILAIVRDRPADLGLAADGEPAGPLHEGSALASSHSVESADGLDLKEAIRTTAFWILFLCHFLWVFANLSIVGHLVAFLSDVGFEAQTAAVVMGVMVGVSVAGRILFGLLSDRIDKRRILALALVCHTVATMCLLRVHAGGAVPFFVIVFGLGLGGGAVLVPLLVGEYFGLVSFGKILGLIMISGAIGAATGPVVTGRIFDVTGHYHMAFLVHIAFFATAAVAVNFMRRPLAQTG